MFRRVKHYHQWLLSVVHFKTKSGQIPSDSVRIQGPSKKSSSGHLYPVSSVKERNGKGRKCKKSLWFYSRLFLVPKPHQRWRPVIDLSRPNTFLHVEKFKMETPESTRTSLIPGEWVSSIDLSDAYPHIPIHPNSRKYLRFCHRSPVFQFTSLPFGLATAPQVFTMFVKQVKLMALSRGLRLHQYLDDWLIRSQSQEEAQVNTQAVVDLTQSLGWIINKEKSELKPTQVFSFVGYEYHLDSALVKPTQERWLKLQDLILRLKSKHVLTARCLMSLIGLLASTEKMVPEGRLHKRPFQFHLKEHWRYPQSLDSLLPWTETISAHLDWWQNPTNVMRGAELHPKDHSIQLFTDASNEGWGAHLEQTSTRGLWSDREKKATHKCPRVEGGLSGSSKFQGPVSEPNSVGCNGQLNSGSLHKQTSRNSLSRDVLTWCHHYQITLKARHIPVCLNMMADLLSRSNQVQSTEWSLHPQVFHQICQRWLTPHVDLFATHRPSTIDGYRTAIVDTLGPAGHHISQSSDLHRLLSSFHRDRPKSSRNLPKWNLSVVLNELTPTSAAGVRSPSWP